MYISNSTLDLELQRKKVTKQRTGFSLINKVGEHLANSVPANPHPAVVRSSEFVVRGRSVPSTPAFLVKLNPEHLIAFFLRFLAALVHQGLQLWPQVVEVEWRVEEILRQSGVVLVVDEAAHGSPVLWIRKETIRRQPPEDIMDFFKTMFQTTHLRQERQCALRGRSCAI